VSQPNPNVLVILVDQMRFPRFAYGPEQGLAEPIKRILGFQAGPDEPNAYRRFFPGFSKLAQNAVVLRNHTIASSACIPSRATIMTGQYGTRTGVTQTDGLFKNGDAPTFPWLSPHGIPTLGHWFRGAGYRTHYFGKWHVSNPPEHTLQRYGFDDWELSWPEPHGANINNLGAYRDHQFADLACSFLRNQSLGVPYNRARGEQEQDAPLADSPSTTPRPWLAVVSFTNPHDIATYPGLPRGLDPDAPKAGPLPVPAEGSTSRTATAGSRGVPLNELGFPQDNAALPPGFDEDLLNNKPSCQFDYSYKVALGLAAKTGLNVHQGASQIDALNATLASGIPFQLTAEPAEAALKFLQYYAWLQYLVDGHIARVLETLEQSGMADDTLVVFMADHGEYGAAHGYMIEKWHSAYQEALHVPVVVHSAAINPQQQPRQIDAVTSHVDILPTLLGLAGIGPAQQQQIREQLGASRPVPEFPGRDLSPLIHGHAEQVHEPDGSAREGVLFITDDEITEPLPIVGDPYQKHSEAEYALFLEAVEVVRTGSSSIPHNGPVPALAPGPVRQPNHVRCVRTQRWKLSRYFDPNGVEREEWELYDLERDPCEHTNLLLIRGDFPTVITPLPPAYDSDSLIAEARRLRALLERLEREQLL
jgi:arylsulfatase A-like enzyme